MADYHRGRPSLGRWPGRRWRRRHLGNIVAGSTDSVGTVPGGTGACPAGTVGFVPGSRPGCRTSEDSSPMSAGARNEGVAVPTMPGSLAAGRPRFGSPAGDCCSPTVVVGNSSMPAVVVVAHTAANIAGAGIVVVGIAGTAGTAVVVAVPGTAVVVAATGTVVVVAVTRPSGRAPVVSARARSRQRRPPCSHHRHRTGDGRRASS